jgi:hypothetical protein
VEKSGHKCGWSAFKGAFSVSPFLHFHTTVLYGRSGLFDQSITSFLNYLLLTRDIFSSAVRSKKRYRRSGIHPVYFLLDGFLDFFVARTLILIFQVKAPSISYYAVLGLLNSDCTHADSGRRVLLGYPCHSCGGAHRRPGSRHKRYDQQHNAQSDNYYRFRGAFEHHDGLQHAVECHR